MVHKDISTRYKLKPTGEPFAKRNKRGKSKNDLLAIAGHESNVKGGDVAPTTKSSPLKPLKAEIEPSKESIPSIKANSMENVKKDLELIDSMDFMNGENKLSIRFSRKHNRMFRIQIFLNDKNEVRPVTYTGASTGWSFWNLLKGSLK